MTIEDINMDLLTTEQVCQKNCLSSLKKYGVASFVTDFCITTGTFTTSNFEKTNCYDYFLKTSAIECFQDYDDNPCLIMKVSKNGIVMSEYDTSFLAIRPIFSYDGLDIEDKIYYVTYPELYDNFSDIAYVDLGFYPMKMTSPEYSQKLSSMLKKGNSDLKLTGKTYSFNKEVNIEVEGEKLEEYIYINTKYVRWPFSYAKTIIECKYENDIWFEVKPIMWLVDQKQKLLISKDSLIAGYRMIGEDIKEYAHSLDFPKTEIYKFLNENFKYEIGLEEELKLEKTDGKTKRLELFNDFYSGIKL